MKKGFTLLELIIVVIIIGILATLGLTQYGKVVEKSRGAEAKQIIGAIRSNAAAYYMQNNSSLTGATGALLGIGTDYPGPAATDCRATHYFYYNFALSGIAGGFAATARRCQGVAGKQPGGTVAASLVLDTNFSTGSDTWTSTGIAY